MGPVVTLVFSTGGSRSDTLEVHVIESKKTFSTLQTVNTAFQSNSSYTTSVVTTPDSERIGVSNPAWRTQVATHNSATTNLTASRFSVKYRHAKIRSEYDPAAFGGPQNLWIDDTREGIITDPHDVIDLSDPATFVDLSRAQNFALQRMYRNIRSARTSFSGGVFLGELRETLELIKRPASLLRRSLDSYATRAYKRVRSVKDFPRGGGVVPPKSRRAVGKALRDTWLEYSLGVMPLVGDIQAGYDTLREKSKAFSQGDAIECQGTGKEEYVYSTDSPGTVIVGHDDFKCTLILQYSGDARYKGAVWGYPYGRPLNDLTLWGLDRTQFIPTLWEVMPYSFLIDYFFNVGDILDAWSMGAVELAWSQLTVRRRANLFRTNWRVNFHDPWTLRNSITQGEFNLLRTTLSRANLGTQLDFPTLTWRLPTRVGQAFNLSALLNLQGVSASKWPKY
jgi:hypothetical protein